MIKVRQIRHADLETTLNELLDDLGLEFEEVELITVSGHLAIFKVRRQRR